MKTAGKIRSFSVLLAFVVVIASSAIRGHAQGYIPSATLSATPAGGGAFNYTLILSNSSLATANIGSLWYAWIPGEFYLPTSPSIISSPAGWSGNEFPAGGATSIQWLAGSPANAIAPGGSLTFGFTSTDTPSVLAGNAPNHPGTPIGRSYVYAGGFFLDPGVEFVVQSVPEPSSVALIAMGTVALVIRHRKSGRINQ